MQATERAGYISLDLAACHVFQTFRLSGSSDEKEITERGFVLCTMYVADLPLVSLYAVSIAVDVSSVSARCTMKEDSDSKSTKSAGDLSTEKRFRAQ